MILPRMRALIPGNAREARAGDGAPAITNFFPSVRRGAERGTRGRVRSLIVTAALCAISLVFTETSAHAAEVIPPKPDGYFNDYAHVVSSETAKRLNEQLAQFERDSSAQVVVAVFPKMESDSSIDDYTRRVAKAWDIGQQQTQNGAALFVFIQDRKMFIQTSHGVEGALPDATCFDITERHIKPAFRAGKYDEGLSIGVSLICQAIRGEYKGLGQTAQERGGNSKNPAPIFVFFVIFVLVMIVVIRAQRKGGYGYSGFGGPFIGGLGGSGGGWSSGGGAGGGFSGFSGGGGGGGFGGGGAGSSW